MFNVERNDGSQEESHGKTRSRVRTRASVQGRNLISVLQLSFLVDFLFRTHDQPPLVDDERSPTFQSHGHVQV